MQEKAGFAMQSIGSSGLTQQACVIFLNSKGAT